MTTPRLNLVVAACNNGGIGIDGRIPWRIKQDLAFFKKITSATVDREKQNAVIMGRKTWFSIPEKLRPLPGRVNIILSREMSEAPKGTSLARSFNEAVELVTSGSLSSMVESVCIIGGSSLYEEAMNGSHLCRIYLTKVLGDFKCDTFLPAIDETTFRKVPNPEDIPSETLTENDIDFKFELYEN